MTHDKPISWPNAVLIAIDQLGNALAGGNPDATVSARVGYFSLHATKPFLWYWQLLAAIIDFAFYPVDGPNHCVDSYTSDKQERFQQGSDVLRALLGLIVISFCLPTALVLRVAVRLYPNWYWANRVGK